MATKRTVLGQRLRRHFFRGIGVASILVFNSVLLLLGYLLTWVIETTTSEGDALLDIARAFSRGTFLLLYLVWVVLDLVEFFRSEYSGQSRDLESGV